MATWSRFQKVALLSLGAVGGGLAYYRINNDTDERRSIAHNAWTTNFTPSVQWDRNWDHREPECLVKPIKRSVGDRPEDDNKYNEKLEKAKSRAVRHLFLIRHGQYNIDGAKDTDRTLTDLGRLQADFTGQRLANLDIKWDLLVQSTMTRAQETANIIAKHLDKDIEVKDCQLIEEGAPIPPEPPVGHWRPEPKFFQDSARIEAGFRRYFYPKQTTVKLPITTLPSSKSAPYPKTHKFSIGIRRQLSNFLFLHHFPSTKTQPYPLHYFSSKLNLILTHISSELECNWRV
nr:serine/threonine-protein phosphatase Pgam5, mitochondrial isoform X4 [Helicoverpa armigera]